LVGRSSEPQGNDQYELFAGAPVNRLDCQRLILGIASMIVFGAFWKIPSA
jgi:hypothetical protein